MILKRLTLLFLLLLVLILPVKTFAAYDSQICVSAGNQCTETEVGPFMKGITKDCGNLGNCLLDDIMEVVGNVGNFVAGIVGGIVLLMYIVGGLYYLTAGGNDGRIKTGKNYLKGSTIGLLIVMFAYLGIQFLQQTLKVSTIEETKTYATCGEPEFEGKECALQKVCSGVACLDLCTAKFAGKFECRPVTPEEEKILSGSYCLVSMCGTDTLRCCPKK